MKKFSKFLFLITAVCLIACVFCACDKLSNNNQRGKDDDLNDKQNKGLVFTLLDDNTYEVSGYEGTDTDVIILPTHEGKTVTSIGESAFFACIGLTSVEIPSSVTSIGDRAFYGCSSLTSVTFAEGSGLQSIGDSAFLGCSSLTSVEIPKSVTSIGEYIFYNCNSLLSATFNGTKDQWNAINKGSFLNSGTGSFTVTCTDGVLDKKEEKTIVVIKFGTHTSLDEINDAIVGTLKEKGDNYKIIEKNAEFSADIAGQIIASVKDRADVVVAIATPVAQVAYNALPDSTPIVFSAVSDPVGAGLVTNLNAPEDNITGTSDEIQIGMLIDLAIETGNVEGNKKLNTLGFIYNPSEANSVSNLAKIQAYCTQKGITLATKTISAAGEMSEIAKALVPTVDAMLVTDDNTVASAMMVLAQECRDAKIPCFTGADSEVKDGGMLCMGINYTQLGKDTAEMVVKILNGTTIKDIPVKVVYNKQSELKVCVNDDYLAETGIVLPASIDTEAAIHYEDRS